MAGSPHDPPPPAPPAPGASVGSSRAARLLPGVAVGALAAGAVTFLVAVEPGSSNPLAALYLECPSRTLFGVLCPLCGGTRAARALVAGDVRAVPGLNLVLPVLLVLGAWAALAATTWRGRSRIPPVPRTAGFWGTLGVLTVVYGVLRNLPVEPFIWLAP
jgi:hypothetical protein